MHLAITVPLCTVPGQCCKQVFAVAALYVNDYVIFTC